MASANPKDLVREFKTSKAGDVMTLLVKPEFFPAWTEDDDQPYRVYDKSFSRLAVTILWKSPKGGKMSVTGNIKIDRLAGIYRKAVNASQIDANLSTSACKWFAGSLQNIMGMLQSPCSAETGAGSMDDRIIRSEKMAAAQAVAIANGKLKGKTPLAALQEGMTDALRQQRNWLSENLPPCTCTSTSFSPCRSRRAARLDPSRWQCHKRRTSCSLRRVPRGRAGRRIRRQVCRPAMRSRSSGISATATRWK